MRRTLSGALLAFLLAGLPAGGARAQAEELGDTKAAPPTAEELGAVPDAAVPPPVEKKPERKPEKKKKPADPPAADTAKPADKGAKPADKAEKPVEKAPPEPVVAPELAAKAKRLRTEVTALLAAEPGDARALENIATSQQDNVVGADPSLKALLKLARGRALTIQSRFDEATQAFQDAKNAIDGVSPREQRRLTAEVRFRLAELDELKGKPPPSCGALGLARVAALEGRDARERVQHLATRYKTVVSTGDRFWGRRAAFRTAMLYDDLYRFAIGRPAGFRGITLPSPFAVDKVDSREVVNEVLGGAWPSEISRLYSEVIASIDAREPDDVLLEHARKKAAEFARLEVPEGEQAKSPWLPDEKPGLVRFNRRFEKRNADGTWTPVEPKGAREVLADNLKKAPGTVEHAYALAALADAGPAPSTEQILAAIGHSDERVVLAGLVAAEKAPDPALLDVLVEQAAKPMKGDAFANLQLALYGLRERALLALRALAAKDRDAANKILSDNRLPARERAWVVAEIGDGRLEYTLQALAGSGEPIVTATALYALYLSAGKNSLGYLRQQDTGVVGCVSRAIATIDTEPKN